MRTPVEQLLQRAVEEGTVPGAVAVLGRYGPDDPEVVAVGEAALGGPPMRADAIVQIQSMTKAVTTVAALRLVEAGRLELDSSVEPWLPELADRRVLRSPGAELDDTEPARRPITVRHLLTNTAGWGMVFDGSPMQRAMAANGTEAGPDPSPLGADEWLARLAELPLLFQPGEGWRYHHGFAVLGILLARVTGRPLQDHLAEDLFGPLGIPDTGFWVPAEDLDRLPAAYRHGEHGLEEVLPAGGGPYAGKPAVDVSHGELVSTAADFHRFARMLADGGRAGDRQVLSAEHLHLMTSDQAPAPVKTPDSFFPGFWDGTGWGFGVGVDTAGAHTGRYGWSGGYGTNFFVDPVDAGGTVGILLTQVEMGDRFFPLLQEFQELSAGR